LRNQEEHIFRLGASRNLQTVFQTHNSGGNAVQRYVFLRTNLFYSRCLYSLYTFYILHGNSELLVASIGEQEQGTKLGTVLGHAFLFFIVFSTANITHIVVPCKAGSIQNHSYFSVSKHRCAGVKRNAFNSSVHRLNHNFFTAVNAVYNQTKAQVAASQDCEIQRVVY